MATLTPQEEMLRMFLSGGAQEPQYFTPPTQMNPSQPKVSPQAYAEMARKSVMTPMAKSVKQAPDMDDDDAKKIMDFAKTGGTDFAAMLQSSMESQKESPQEAALRKKIEDDQKAVVEKQEATIGTQEEIAKLMLTREPSSNLNPLLNLIDSWTGSNLSDGYKPPQTQQEIAAQAFNMQDKISQLRGDLNKSQTSFLKDQLESLKKGRGTDPLDLMNFMRREEASKTALALRKDQFGTGLVDKIEKDKVVSKANDAMAAASNIRELISSNNPIADAAIPTYLARASGEVGALTEADKAPFGGTRALIGKIEQALTEAVSGRLSEPNRRFVLQLAETMERAAQKNILRRKKYHADNLSRAQKQFTKSELYDMLDLDEEQVAAPARESAAAPQAPEMSIQSAAAEELARRRAQKAAP